MAGNYDYLFGGNTPSSMTDTLSDSSSSLPAWLQELTRGMAGQATAIAGADYSTYSAPTNAQNYGVGTRVAGYDPAQTQAYNQVMGSQGNYQPYLNYASQTVPQAVGAYMDPYNSAVTDRIAQLGQRNLTENLLPQVNSTFTGAGQFGSTRDAMFNNRAVRDANESILGQQAQLLQSGYQQAQTAANADMTRQANLGQLTQQLGAQQASLLDTVGQEQQGQYQKSMDLAYNDFLQQRDYQKNNLSFLSDIVRGMQVPTSTFSTQSSVPTTANQLSPLAAATQGFLGARSIMSPTVANTPQR